MNEKKDQAEILYQLSLTSAVIGALFAVGGVVMVVMQGAKLPGAIGAMVPFAVVWLIPLGLCELCRFIRQRRF